MLINPHSWIASMPWEAAVSMVMAVVVTMAGLRSARRHAVARAARAQGLSEPGAAFLGRALRREGPGRVAELLASPHRLRERLAQRLARRREPGAASRFAEAAAAVLDELHAREAAFDGAPLPFDMVMVSDALDPASPSVRAWIVDADEHSLTLVATRPCPWPIRRDLHVTRMESAAEPHTFTGTIVLRPVPGCSDWVMNHDLAEGLANRRHAARVPCQLTAHTVPSTGDVAALREKLRRGDPVDMARLRRTEAWHRRHTVLLTDLSPAGAGMLADHEVQRHDSFHVVVEEGGRLLALPLAEVVDARSAPGGRLALGTRFAGMRLTERVTLADLARRFELAPTVADGE